MNFAWKFMLPMTLLNVFVAGVWRFTGDAGYHAILRWIICGGILVGAYLLFGKQFKTSIKKREYRYGT